MLSLTAIGHSWWMLLELVTLACALMSMFSVLATGLREKGLALVTPLVLLLVECSLTLTIAWGHGAVIRGSGDAGAQYMRLLGLSAVIPLLLDLGVVVLARKRRARGSVGAGAKKACGREFVPFQGRGETGVKEARDKGLGPGETNRRARGRAGRETKNEPGQLRRILTPAALVGNPRGTGEKIGVDTLLFLGALATIGWGEDLASGTPMPGQETLVRTLILGGSGVLAALSILLFASSIISLKAPGPLTFKRAFEEFPGLLALGGVKGPVAMTNAPMHHLLIALGLNTAQPLNQIWQALCVRAEEDELNAIMHRSLEGTPQHLFIRMGESVWQLRYKENDDAPESMRLQLWGEDLSEDYALARQLVDENAELEEATRGLRESIEEAGALVAQQDIVGTRLRLHDVLAQRLTFVRHFLAEGVGEVQRTRALSQMLTSLGEDLRADTSTPTAARLGMIVSGCALMGTRCEVSGPFPEDEDVASVLMSVLSQAVVNAVLHAEAEHITVRFSQSQSAWTMTIANPITDAVDVVEKTGLAGMRTRVEALGGWMRVHADTSFVVRVCIPRPLP
ncbi:sensor histidine kinase [Schaalia cardiffensis]